ncbi:hypothetical protein [Chryseobacterium taihuense]|uniref:Uncharacterized protein n=1 Tax=Chryseobacterium taihuense TaxID=1141221 RepID=A0ABY0QSZ9_9FLAO|nr:hypothetical protein [Chryseobacterium taihuense]SDL78971.1 hypothetical protein SAMN05216273_106106 [Chryseobacterium taihuense]
MCKVSNEIKFCTCNKSKLIDSVNYWIIYRRKKGWKIGETVFNENFLSLAETELEKIESNLNSTNMFDFDYIPLDDDKLLINLYYNGKNCEYTFKYTKNKWEIYNDALEWLEDIENGKFQYLIEHKGIITNAFE